MKRSALVIGVVLAEVGIFAVVAMSVVDARDPLDREVEASFVSTVEALTTPAARIDAGRCVKKSLAYYDCAARVRIRGRDGLLRVVYKLRVAGDGCWETTKTLHELRGALRKPRGCIED
jgi:hypothetical protein